MRKLLFCCYLVVFSGILYHMIDPLAGLGMARSFVREDGLFIIETSAFITDELVLKFNGGGKYYKGSNYFQVGLGCLDYFLRMLRLRPIDCVFEKRNWDICRVSIVCRAESAPIALGEDEWINKQFVRKDFHAYNLFYDKLKSDKPEVAYEPINKSKLVYHEGTNCVNLYETVVQNEKHETTDKQGMLHLSDMI